MLLGGWRPPLWILLAVALGAAGPTPGRADGVHEVSRSAYADRLHGFWLGQSIANWTGLTTEMVRVEPPFFTDADWATTVRPTIWGHFPAHSGTIDFFLLPRGKAWGADDDTDIEYMYQYLLERSDSVVLTGEAIRDGWLNHIYSNRAAPLSPNTFERENYLWVSNERALELMERHGMIPPATSAPGNNDLAEMIDAQLTTELFGLLAPTRPDVALKLADLPIRVAARGDAALIAGFYVVMHALAAAADPSLPLREQVLWLAREARATLPEGSTPAAMFDFVWAAYSASPDPGDWERVRDAVYERYQLHTNDGYTYRQGFDAGINFAASLVSLFFGEGDIRNTIRIGTLAGWDADNPTATWGGLLGFLIGRHGIETAFGREDLSEAFWIHRTRRNFPDHTPNEIGEDRFSLMAERGVEVIDRVVTQQMGGRVAGDRWLIPPAETADD